MSLYCHAANLTCAQQTTELLSRSLYRKKNRVHNESDTIRSAATFLVENLDFFLDLFFWSLWFFGINTALFEVVE